MENIQEEIEDKVIDCINTGVSGRLVIFKPEKNIFGEDLVVEKRAKYKEKEMFLQINSLAKNMEDFLPKKFKPNENLYLVFIYFDEVRQKINDSLWLVPSLNFVNIKSKDEFSKFLIKTEDFGKAVLNLFPTK
jgi:hypothetical protein